MYVLKARSSVGEHYLDTVGVSGSIPLVPTIWRTLKGKALEALPFFIFCIVPVVRSGIVMVMALVSPAFFCFSFLRQIQQKIPQKHCERSRCNQRIAEVRAAPGMPMRHPVFRTSQSCVFIRIHRSFPAALKSWYNGLVTNQKRSGGQSGMTTDQQQQHDTNDEQIISEFRNTLAQYKTIVVTGDEGVGKIVFSLAAMKDMPNVLYIGNPLDFRGQSRPGGYEQYLDHIKPLKPDLSIVATETDTLSLKPEQLIDSHAILLIDEVYGRSETQRAKLYELIGTEGIKTVIVTGCMKNLHNLVSLVDAGLMLTGRSALFIEGDYIKKLCPHLQPESFTPEK